MRCSIQFDPLLTKACDTLPQSNLSGQHIKGYHLLELIGVGGFAAVYRAHQPAINRDVAIKVILPKFANNPDFVRRFETEAQLIARLEHIHIVPLYDYWREPDNAYLVMRWLRGGNLAQSIQMHGAWAVTDIARLLDQVAAALTVAHRNGIVHQDLTPVNILLDEENNALLADFGIAKDLVRAATTDEHEPRFGAPAYMAPEQILRDPITPQTDIYSLGIVLYELLTGQVPFSGLTHTTVISQQLNEPVPALQVLRPDIPYVFNIIVLRAAAKNPQVRYPDALSLAADFRRAMQMTGMEAADQPVGVTNTASSVPVRTQALSPDTIPLGNVPLPAPVNPYRGLRPFEEADAAYFYGRQTLIAHLIDRLRSEATRGRFLAIVGPSGSGKSSVMRAGVIPALRRGELPGSEDWFIAKMVPGSSPFDALATALLSVAFNPPDHLADVLRQDERGLLNVVNRIFPDEASRLVLVIDQFEELFIHVTDESERGLFLDCLQQAVTAADDRLFVLITLRADFYDRPLLYPGFGELVRANTEVVLPLSMAELQEAITEPARRAGLVVDSDLVTAILADVNRQPGTLPLLQYALSELYERRTDERLTEDAYRASGGVLAALASRAEDLYDAMSGADQNAVRQVFLRLVKVGDSVADTRRRVSWSELLAVGHTTGHNPRSAIERFGSYRLLTFDHDPQTRTPTVEIAHEALIREWARLRIWIDDSREDLYIQQQLSAAAAQWIAADRDSSYLIRGARLAQFEAMADRTDLTLIDDDRAFLHSSVQQRQRALWRLRAFVAVLLAAVVVMSVLVVFAVDRQRQTERARATAIAERDRADLQARISRSRELAVTALKNLDQGDLALLLSLEAERAASTLEARSSLLTALETFPYVTMLLHDSAASVRAAAYSPDGRILAAGNQAGDILLWDSDTGRVAAQVSVENDVINALAFSPRGDVLAAGTSSGAILFWDVSTRSQMGQPLTGHSDAVWSLAFNVDGTRLVSGGADGQVLIWDTAARDLVTPPITGHTDIVFSVAFSPDGTLLASGSADGTIRLWDANSGEPIGQPFVGHTNWVWSVAFSPDGQTLVSGGADNTVRLWDVASGDAIGEPLTAHTGAVRSVAFSPDGTLIASGSADGTVRLWTVAAPTEPPLLLAVHQGAVWSVVFSPDGRTLASGGLDDQVILSSTGAPLLRRQMFSAGSEAILGLGYSPDGHRLATAEGQLAGGTADGIVRIWDTTTGVLLATIHGHSRAATSVAFSPDGLLLASVAADGTLVVWDASTYQPVRGPIQAHQSAIVSVAFSPDSRLIVTGGDDSSVRLWDATTGQPAGSPLVGHTDSVQSVAFSPDGRLLASGSRDATVRLWDVATGQPVGSPLVGHTDSVQSVAFSPDGRLLASGSRDATVRLWDVATREPVGQPLTGHSNWVWSVAFSPDGQMLASGSYDTTIILWDVAAGQPIGLPLPAHSDLVTGLAFSPDGQTLASSSWDATVKTWTISLPAWQILACQIAHRNLSAEEWARYFSQQVYTITCPDDVPSSAP